MIEADPDKVVATGRAELGVSESPAFTNRTKYGEWYGMNGVPWCAIWVSWVFAHAGFPLPAIRTSKGFAYVPDVVDWAQQTQTWRRVGKYTPKRGDLVVFTFGGKRPDHIGIVQGVLEDGRVWTLEGNSNSGGSRTGGSVVELYRRNGIIGFVETKPIVPNIDWAALRRMLAAKLREQYGACPNMGPGHPACCEVVTLQQTLNLISGAGLKEDGVYGDATRDAVQRFQTFMNGLTPGTITDPPGCAFEGTRWWLCTVLQNIRDGKA